MWSPYLLCAVPILGGGLAAQTLRLENKVATPLVYMAQRAPEDGGEDVLSALHDRAFLAGLGFDQRDVKEVDAGGAVLHSVQQLLSRLSLSSQASEMALVGLLNLGGNQRPLLVFHSELRPGGAAEIRELLDSGKLTRPTRKVHARQVYEFRAGGVEVALVERDLVVSNDKKTMARVLDPRTVAGGGFGADPRFQRLRKKLQITPGSLLFYADWQALQPRLQRIFAGDAAWMMARSGIQVPEQLMFVARPAPRGARKSERRGIITTFLLQHASDSHKFSTGNSDPATVAGWHPDGWLDLLRHDRAHKLLGELPPGGVATIVGSLDVNRLLPTHPGRRMRRLQAAIFQSCGRLDIDLRRQVLRRLGETGGIQLMVVAGESSGPGSNGRVRMAYTIRAKSSRRAKELFDVFGKAFVGREIAEMHDSGGHDELRFKSRYGEGGLVLSVVNDALVLAFDSSVIQRVRALSDKRKTTQLNRRRNAIVLSRLQRLGVSKKRVSGLFVLDLGFLADSGGDGSNSKSEDRCRGLLGLHAGFFTLEKDLVRLEVFTELEVP